MALIRGVDIDTTLTDHLVVLFISTLTLEWDAEAVAASSKRGDYEPFFSGWLATARETVKEILRERAHGMRSNDRSVEIVDRLG